jgi:GATA zinc finger
MNLDCWQPIIERNPSVHDLALPTPHDGTYGLAQQKGPQGPKTLCNACGLRWAKKAKKSPNAHEGFVNTAATAPAEGS